MRCLLGRPPASDLFGRKGRAWLAEQELPQAEQETVAGVLRQLDFLAREIGELDRQIATLASASTEFKHLLTIPGVDVGRRRR